MERRGWHCEYVGVKREDQLIAAYPKQEKSQNWLLSTLTAEF